MLKAVKRLNGKVIMHSCNNTVAPGVTVNVQTVLLQQQHMLAVVYATPSLRRR